jgi:hypothetical protein
VAIKDRTPIRLDSLRRFTLITSNLDLVVPSSFLDRRTRLKFSHGNGFFCEPPKRSGSPAFIRARSLTFSWEFPHVVRVVRASRGYSHGRALVTPQAVADTSVDLHAAAFSRRDETVPPRSRSGTSPGRPS